MSEFPTFRHPFVRKLVDEARRAGYVKVLLRVLAARFGEVTPTVAACLEQVTEESSVARLAAICANLQHFEEGLIKELSAPSPVSVRS
jgi:hypothetical protein